MNTSDTIMQIKTSPQHYEQFGFGNFCTWIGWSGKDGLMNDDDDNDENDSHNDNHNENDDNAP